MIGDDDEDALYDGPDIIEEAELDPVAARCSAFTKLLSLCCHIKDEELKKEALMMLGAVRRSFKTNPIGELASIQGGKASNNSDN